MNTKMNWDLFEKVEIRAGRSYTRGDYITVAKDKKSFTISKSVAVAANIKVGDRFDLYRVGKTFALKKAKVGVLKVVSNNCTFVVRSMNACLEILALNGSCHNNEAWVEDDVIFFRPIEKVGE